ncbi:MAG: hypothetical protein HY360_18470 [Verrucomicrobia bacterium]|nr:hypothetical protein [Verrucomicrobiota bacterium]
MNVDAKTTLVLAGLTALFLALSSSFRASLWGNPEPLPVLPLVDAVFTNTATVRVSAAELIRSGGDTSNLECNTCHEENKPGKLEFDAKEQVVLPAGHPDLVMQHGRKNRNENCYNCHDEANHALLRTRDGHKLKLEESTLLCASCHGPNYRDWEAGIHGRTSGHWNRQIGPISRKGCADCHNPHAPAFPSLKPAPGPHALHARSAETHEAKGGH